MKTLRITAALLLTLAAAACSASPTAPTPEASGPGPQRIVSGQDGDLWYTPDHYETFRKLEPSKN